MKLLDRVLDVAVFILASFLIGYVLFVLFVLFLAVTG